jgi:hypothetical protein
MIYQAIPDGSLTGQMALYVEFSDLANPDLFEKVFDKLPLGTLVFLQLEHHTLLEEHVDLLKTYYAELPGQLVVELDSRGTTPMPREWMHHVSWLKVLTNPKHYGGMPASEYVLYVHDKHDLDELNVVPAQQNIWLNLERVARDELLSLLREITFSWKLHITGQPSFRWEFTKNGKRPQSTDTPTESAHSPA